MQLRCFVDVPEILLQQVSAALTYSPALAVQLGHEVAKLTVPLPANWKPSINQKVHALEMTFSKETGTLYGLSEVGDGVSGGWVGSCMPTGLVVKFLRAWLLEARKAGRPKQPGLFD